MGGGENEAPGLENTEQQMVLRNGNLSDDEADHDRKRNSKVSWEVISSNSRKGKEPVGPDQCGKEDNNPSEDDDTRALEWLPMCSRKDLVMELLWPVFRI